MRSMGSETIRFAPEWGGGGIATPINLESENETVEEASQSLLRRGWDDWKLGLKISPINVSKISVIPTFTLREQKSVAF